MFGEILYPELRGTEAGECEIYECPGPGSFQGQAGWGPGQHDLMGGLPAHGREVANLMIFRVSLGALPTPNVLWFYEWTEEQNRRNSGGFY